MDFKLASKLAPEPARLLRGIEFAWLAWTPGVRRAAVVPAEFTYYTRNGLVLENRVYESATFRKMHMEAAYRDSDGLHVVHCVAFPRAHTTLPILGIDMVSTRQRVTFAIADATPVVAAAAAAGSDFQGAMEDLQAHYDLKGWTQVSRPPWASDLFSDSCVAMRPRTTHDLSSFVDYAVDLARLHASADVPVAADPGAVRAAHAQYCRAQLENDKTFRVLEKAIGPAAAERYMRTVMFDCL